jgi:hypothetical protein
MFHRPNFCCSCGEKIERIEWHIWTSRRYCELCETETRLDELLPRTFCVFLLVFGLFGAGSLIGSSGDVPDLAHSPVRMARQRAQQIASTAGPLDAGVRPGQVSEPPPVAPARTSPAPEGSEMLVREQAPEVEERYYFCGAATKKGTACTRKVKGGGRCWQHKGREAILPERELEIK